MKTKSFEKLLFQGAFDDKKFQIVNLAHHQIGES
jgi:hypothetical protein